MGIEQDLPDRQHPGAPFDRQPYNGLELAGCASERGWAIGYVVGIENEPATALFVPLQERMDAFQIPGPAV